jgi:hypothetical protein
MAAAILLACSSLAIKNEKDTDKCTTFTADITINTQSIYLCWHQLHRHDSNGLWEDIQVVSFICDKHINPKIYKAFSPSPIYTTKRHNKIYNKFRKRSIFRHKIYPINLHPALFLPQIPKRELWITLV